MIQDILPKLLERKPLNSSEQKKLNTLVKQILRTDESNWSSDEHYLIGFLNEQDQRYEKAAPFYESAIELNPAFEAAYYGYGVCLSEVGDTEGALEQFNKAIELDSSYLYAQLGKARILRRLNKANEAIEVLVNMNSDEDFEADMQSELAACYEQTGDTEKALSCINKALEIEKGDANFIAQRALLFLFSGEYEKALADFLVSQKSAGVNYVTQFNLGLCYGMITGKDKDAHQMFTRSFNKFPGLLKDYFSNATEHEMKRLEKQIEQIISRLTNMDSSAPGKFYRDELIELLQRKLDDALKS